MLTESIAVSYHLWPWSMLTAEESTPVVGDDIAVKFYGSPVLSVDSGAKLFLTARMEKFIPLGPKTPQGEIVYETPHGVFSQGNPVQHAGMMVQYASCRWNVDIKVCNAVLRISDDTRTDSPLSRLVLGWAQFFDDLLEKYEVQGRPGCVSWDDVLTFLRDQKKQQESPRFSLIVRIAEKMRTKLPETVSRMRRILLRERSMQRINRIAETDVRCMQWYARQPGMNMAEKGGHKQELMAVVRRESFDVLENRVLKDFIKRCDAECLRYIQSEVDVNDNFKDSKRALDVRQYRETCVETIRCANFENVHRVAAGVRPNYVLQQDVRYSTIWKWYCRLLRKEDEEDQVWDWQSRTWADIVRLLVNLAIVWLGKMEPRKNDIQIRQVFASTVRVTREQVMGSRTRGGSEPGPFKIEKITRGQKRLVAILEVVHSDKAHENSVTKNLGRTGGHLYLVVRPIDNSLAQNHVFVVWGVNSAGAQKHKPWEDVSHSALNALKINKIALSLDRAPHIPELQGIIAASDLNVTKTDVICESSQAPVVVLPADPRHWIDAVECFAWLLYARLDELL